MSVRGNLKKHTSGSLQKPYMREVTIQNAGQGIVLTPRKNRTADEACEETQSSISMHSLESWTMTPNSGIDTSVLVRRTSHQVMNHPE